MRIMVNGADRTDALRPVLEERLPFMHAHGHAVKMLESVYTALSLRDATSDGEFLDRFVALLWHKTGVSTQGFYMPRPPGVLSAGWAWCKQQLWRLMRYQHNRIAWQQNMINTQLTVAVEFLHGHYRAELDALRRRVAELEAERRL